jgi:hypothetical protein
MSADNPAVAVSIGNWRLDMRSVRVLRYALGSTIAMTAAMGFNWQLAFLTPVLSLSFLVTPAPRPTLKQGIGFVATIALACLIGLLVGRYLLSYPVVYIPFAGFLLLRIFYMMASGRSPLLTMWLLIAVLVIPLIMITSPAIANQVAGGILIGSAATVVSVWLAYGLLPDPPGTSVAAAAPAATPGLPPVVDRFKTAAISTLVVLPVLTLIYAFRMQSATLILVFVALLSSQPGFAADFKAGKALIVGNIMGGAAAIVVYELLVMLPEFYFLILLTFLGGLIFGTRVFSDRPTAKLFAMAFSTLLLVIGSTTASGSNAAGSKVYERVMQISIAVVWVVLASGVADRFVRRREDAQ